MANTTIKSAVNRSRSLSDAIDKLQKSDLSRGQKTKLTKAYNHVSEAGRILAECKTGKVGKKKCSTAGRELEKGDIRFKARKSGLVDWLTK